MAIGLNIGGEAISAATLRDSLDDLLTLLNDASVVADAGQQAWTVDNLAIGSAIFAVAAPNESPVAVVLRDGLAALTERAEVPATWTRRMVERVRSIGQRVGRGGATGMTFTGLDAGGLVVTPEIVTHADRALGAATVSYGSARGVVDRWNEHGRREVKMKLDDDSSVTVSYRAALSDRIRDEAIGRRVEMWGLVSRDALGSAIELKAEDFEVLPDRRLVSISEVSGIFADESGEPWFTLGEWQAARGE